MFSLRNTFNSYLRIIIKPHVICYFDNFITTDYRMYFNEDVSSENAQAYREAAFKIYFSKHDGYQYFHTVLVSILRDYCIRPTIGWLVVSGLTAI